MIYCAVKHVFSICLPFLLLWEVMADRGKFSDVEEVDLLNVSFREMELGKDIDVTKLL